MFGYITTDMDELKIREYRRYQAFYCGVCKSLQKDYGPVAQMTLTYDMSFLGLLFSALYEDETEPRKVNCMVHPFRRHEALTNSYTEYASAVNVMLAYYKCEDDWQDEKKLHKKGEAALLKQSCKKAARKYPAQATAIREYIAKQAEAEQNGETDLDKISGITGEMLGNIFAFREDEWKPSLYRMGYFLGKFIYIMDAYDDLTEDLKKGNFNPLTACMQEEHFDERVREMLTVVAAESAKAFEFLPIIQDVEILRNIIYSGIWMKFEQIAKKRTQVPEKQ